MHLKGVSASKKQFADTKKVTLVVLSSANFGKRPDVPEPVDDSATQALGLQYIHKIKLHAININNLVKFNSTVNLIARRRFGPSPLAKWVEAVHSGWTV